MEQITEGQGKMMTTTLQVHHGDESAADYIRWIISSETAKEHWASYFARAGQVYTAGSALANKEAIEIVEKYLSDNFWIPHTYPNGYPVKVMAKADFLGMLNELKRSL